MTHDKCADYGDNAMCSVEPCGSDAPYFCDYCQESFCGDHREHQCPFAKMHAIARPWSDLGIGEVSE